MVSIHSTVVAMSAQCDRTWSLQNHLTGNVTRSTMLCFEGALGFFVKDRVRRQFPDVESEEELGEKAFHAKLLELERKVADLSLQIVDASKDKQMLQGGTMEALGARKKAAAAELREHQRKKPCTKTTERYILESRWAGLVVLISLPMHMCVRSYQSIYTNSYVYNDGKMNAYKSYTHTHTHVTCMSINGF